MRMMRRQLDTKSNKKRRATQLNQGKSALSLPFVKRLKCTRHGQEKKTQYSVFKSSQSAPCLGQVVSPVHISSNNTI